MGPQPWDWGQAGCTPRDQKPRHRFRLVNAPGVIPALRDAVVLCGAPLEEAAHKTLRPWESVGLHGTPVSCLMPAGGDSQSRAVLSGADHHLWSPLKLQRV